MNSQAIEASLRVQDCLFYKAYSITHTHVACMAGQYHTFKVTSFGWASIYGCCGI